MRIDGDVTYNDRRKFKGIASTYMGKDEKNELKYFEICQELERNWFKTLERINNNETINN